jgi:hypothetical protein
VVVVLCADYERKEWCGLEWRAVRDLIKRRQEQRVMLLLADEVTQNCLHASTVYVDIA